MNLRSLFTVLLAVTASTLWMAATASATSLTSPEGELYEGSLIMESEGHAVLANPLTKISCAVKIEGTVAVNGEDGPAGGEVGLLSFSGCTNSWHVTSESTGSYSVESTSGDDGTLFSDGAKFRATRFGVNCVYETEETAIGTVTGGSPAILDVEAEVPIVAGESSGLCGSGAAAWEASIEFAVPAMLGVAKTIQYRSTASPLFFRGVQSAAQYSEWVTQGLKSTCAGEKAVIYETDETTTPAKTITLKPGWAWASCNNFDYTFFSPKSVTEPKSCTFEFLEPNVALESNVAIRCKEGESIRIHGQSMLGTCEVKIGESGNTNLAKNRYKNLGGTPSKFEVSFEITGITAVVTASTGNCGMSLGTIKNASYTAQVHIEDQAAKAGVSIE